MAEASMASAILFYCLFLRKVGKKYPFRAWLLTKKLYLRIR